LNLTLTILSVGIALAVGLVLQPVVLQVMLAKSIIDTPNDRSSHSIPTPRGGGVAIAAAAACALLFSQTTRLIALPLLAFAAIGLAEDVRGIPIRWRLVLQALSAVGAAVVIATSTTTVVAMVAVTIWVVAYANIFNFMDGVNGISALNAILAAAVYAAIGWVAELHLLTYAGLIVAAASATFLPWNAGRAKIFLGDVGSYGLGGILGTLAAYAVLRGEPIEAALAPLALYVTDTSWTLLKRWRSGAVWYMPHRSHIYQQLTTLGWTHQRVAVFTAAVGLIISGCAAAAYSGSTALRIFFDLLALALLIGYLSMPQALRRISRAGSAER
jgi:UDP-N-acetylmuramyl pentapeptide phosphotransferase/UDP-N-acetylglucosamine-1-phosphate transferase